MGLKSAAVEQPERTKLPAANFFLGSRKCEYRVLRRRGRANSILTACRHPSIGDGECSRTYSRN